MILTGSQTGWKNANSQLVQEGLGIHQYRKGKSVPKLFLAFTYLAHIYLQTKKESTKSIYSHIIIVC